MDLVHQIEPKETARALDRLLREVSSLPVEIWHLPHEARFCGAVALWMGLSRITARSLNTSTRGRSRKAFRKKDDRAFPQCQAEELQSVAWPSKCQLRQVPVATGPI